MVRSVEVGRVEVLRVKIACLRGFPLCKMVCKNKWDAFRKFRKLHRAGEEGVNEQNRNHLVAAAAAPG